MSAPVTVAGVEVGPGRRRDAAPVVSQSLTSDPVTMPIAVVNGARPGPRLFVTAAIHGDEIGGTVVCRDLLARIEPEALRGVLVVVPAVAVPAMQARTRRLPDDRDLNRTFPGSETGSMTARLAHLVLEQVVAGSTAGIDLHTAVRGRVNVPQVRVDPAAGADDLARAFAAPYVLESIPPEGALRAVAADRDVPVVTYEAGEALRLDPEAVAVGVGGLVRVMAHLGMWHEEDAPTPDGVTRVLRGSRWVRAERGGVLDLHVAAGGEVDAGQPLWTTWSPLGPARGTVRSPAPGVVIGAATLPLVAPGDAVLHLARDRPDRD